MHRFIAVIAGLVALLALPSGVSAEEVSFVAVLSGANEVPPVDTSASGIAHVVVDTDLRVLRFDLHVLDISNVILAHIHRAPAGVNGGIIYNLALQPFSTPLTGEVRDFNLDDLADFMDGNTYVNVHTTQNPSGEIRGQLQPGELRGVTVTFAQLMSPDNEVPPTDVDAAALSSITLDLKLMGNRVVAGTTTFNVDYRFATSVTFGGLHIHEAPAGTNAGVIIDSGLRPTTDPDGKGNIALKAPMMRADRLAVFERILANPSGFYVNLHTTIHPSGAVRAQLQRLVRRGLISG